MQCFTFNSNARYAICFFTPSLSSENVNLLHSARLISPELSLTNIRKQQKAPGTIAFFSLIWAFGAWGGGVVIYLTFEYQLSELNYHFSDAQSIQRE